MLPDLCLWPVSGKKMLQTFGVLGPDIVFGYDFAAANSNRLTNVSVANTNTLVGSFKSFANAAEDAGRAMNVMKATFTINGYAADTAFRWMTLETI